jgi:hypothetical protein
MSISERRTVAIVGGVIAGLSAGGMVESIANVYQGHFVPLGGAVGLGLGMMFAAVVPTVDDPRTKTDVR